MTSLPAHFAFSTPEPSTSLNVRDALASYRRSQYFLSSSNVSSPDLTETNLPDVDPEACILPTELEGEDEVGSPDSNHTVLPPEGLVNTLEWDKDYSFTPAQRNPCQQSFTRQFSTPTPQETREVAPLLRKSLSFSAPSPRPYLATARRGGVVVPTYIKTGIQLLHSDSTGRISSSSAIAQHKFGGKSTFGQTLFNAVAVLLGIGMLSEPLAFAYAGWGCGTILITFYGFLTCYTAKILAHFILSDPRLRTYADIGRKAFGSRSTLLISFLFCLELFTVCVALVTLYADSLETILPSHSSNFYKVIGLVVFIPTVFLPLSLLSVSSLLGIVSSVLLIAVILIDGFSKKEAPGSLWEPAPTSFGVASATKLGISFGLFMAGFSGHAVIPSLVRDMVNPSRFDEMIDLAFAIATFIYAAIGISGYYMFGNDVSEEFSQDLLGVPEYNAGLNKVALWLLVISPLSKFGLAARPLNATFENILGLDNTLALTSLEDTCSRTTVAASSKSQNETLKKMGIIVERTLFTLCSVGVSILVPEFSAMMSFLGAFSAFLLCVIGPVCAKVAISGRCGRWDGFILVVASAMALWGTFSVWYTTE